MPITARIHDVPVPERSKGPPGSLTVSGGPMTPDAPRSGRTRPWATIRVRSDGDDAELSTDEPREPIASEEDEIRIWFG